jgi:hypothetical protein
MVGALVGGHVERIDTDVLFRLPVVVMVLL